MWNDWCEEVRTAAAAAWENWAKGQGSAILAYVIQNLRSANRNLTKSLFTPAALCGDNRPHIETHDDVRNRSWPPKLQYETSKSRQQNKAEVPHIKRPQPNETKGQARKKQGNRTSQKPIIKQTTPSQPRHARLVDGCKWSRSEPWPPSAALLPMQRLHDG
ncbi:hypothetical protein BJ742DRAFT_20858 [Cladochytrium replicatum]|nr:hypothetical protein BJ742DRAFT_20858 [Cladochytrium replicatum]